MSIKTRFWSFTIVSLLYFIIKYGVLHTSQKFDTPVSILIYYAPFFLFSLVAYRLLRLFEGTTFNGKALHILIASLVLAFCCYIILGLYDIELEYFFPDYFSEIGTGFSIHKDEDFRIEFFLAFCANFVIIVTAIVSLLRKRVRRENID